MHIAFLISSLSKGGSERVLVNLADYLVNRGHQVTVVTQYQKEDEYPLNKKAKRILSDITAAETTGSRIRNFYRRFMKLRRIWQNPRGDGEKPDIILSFIGMNNFMAIITSRFLKIPAVVAVRCAPHTEYTTRFMRNAANFLFRFADGVIYQTEAYHSFFSDAVNRRAIVLKNPMNPAFFRPRYQGEREKTIVNTSRVVSYKNQRLLIKAFDRIAEKFPEYELIIYGEGDMRTMLVDEVSELGLSGRIHLPGPSDRLHEVIYRATVHVLSSDFEGSPNALIEAMLLGLTCLAVDCAGGGPAELIKPGKNGLLTPLNDVDKMAENLQYLLENPDIAAQMGAEAHQLQEALKIEKIGADWEKYLMGKVK